MNSDTLIALTSVNNATMGRVTELAPTLIFVVSVLLTFAIIAMIMLREKHSFECSSQDKQ